MVVSASAAAHNCAAAACIAEHWIPVRTAAAGSTGAGQTADLEDPSVQSTCEFHGKKKNPYILLILSTTLYFDRKS